jgi:hypothetical protein
MVLRSGRVWSVTLLLAVAATNANAQVGRGFRGRGSADTAEKLSRGALGFSGFTPQPGGARRLLFGFALECSKCQPSNRRGGFGAGPMAIWHYDEFPRIAAVVAGSPAARAGIQLGDLLLDVGGASIMTDAGAEAFSALRGGDTATLTLERNGKSYNATLVLGRGFGTARGGPLRFDQRQPHFSARFGTTAIDIDSDVPVISTTDSSGTTTLRIGSTTIRLRPAAKSP